MAEVPSFKIQRDYESPPNILDEVPGQQMIREIDSNFHDDEEQDLQNEGYGIPNEMETTEQSKGYTEGPLEDKSNDARRSRIPQVKFKQTVKKVQKERKEHSKKDQPHNIPRRSSIPKLKDAKAVKRKTSLKTEEKLDDEFDRIYEEIIGNRQSDIDEKILAVKIDDPEKVETKFDEIICAYDTNDDDYLTHKEKLKLSKIPWRRKENTTNQPVTADKKSPLKNPSIKDGGFKVSASTITTKRIARGNSTDANKISKDVDSLNHKDKAVMKLSKTTDIVVDIPGKNNSTFSGVNNSTGLTETDAEVQAQDVHGETFKIEQMEGRKINTNKITKIPIKPERLNRNISRDLNRRPPKLDDKDFVNREVVKHEVLKDKETLNKEPQIRTEKLTRNISRTFSRDGKSITVSTKNKQIPGEKNKDPTDEANDPGINNTISTDLIPNNKQNYVNTEKYRDSINTKLPTPVITKTTHSYSKGNIRNIERSRSIEWKAPDEIIIKKYDRSHSENKPARTKPMEYGDEVTTTNISHDSCPQSPKIENDDDKIDAHMIDDTQKLRNVLRDTTDTLVSEEQEDLSISLNNLEDSQEFIVKPTESITEWPSQDEINSNDAKTVEKSDPNVENDNILKGKVGRLITQISVKDNTDIRKKDIDVEKDLPKKKSVLSKIAMFEGKKDPEKLSIKIKKPISETEINASNATKNIDKKSYSEGDIFTTNDDLDNYKNNVDVTDIDNTEKRIYCDTPVIVDQIWKFQEENILTEHEIQNVTILPEPIEYTVSESNVELMGNFNNQEQNQLEVSKTLSTEITAKSDENVIEHTGQPPKTPKTPKTLDHVYSEKQSEKAIERQPSTSLPAYVDLIPRENQDRKMEYLQDKIITTEKDKLNVQKPKVGKLNLDLWNKQVEGNKQLIRKGNTMETSESQSKIPKTTLTNTSNVKLHTGAIDKSESILDNENADPVTIPQLTRQKSEGNLEMPTILPEKKYYTSSVSLNEAPKREAERIDFDTNEGQLQVPVVLPGIPLTKSQIIEFEPPATVAEVPVVFPLITELKSDTYTAETSNIESEEFDIVIDNNTAQIHKRIPEQSSTMLKQNIMESTEFKAGQHTVEDYFIEPPLGLEVTIDIPNKSKLETLSQDLFYTLENEDNKLEPLPRNLKLERKSDYDSLDKETPSDPELVDSEPEIKDTKNTIMGKLKNKLYLITNRNINKNKLAANQDKPPSPTTPSFIDDKTDKDRLYTVLNDSAPDIRNNEVRKLQRNSISQDCLAIRNDTTIATNRVQNTISRFKPKEELKRAKSLAELDLGDAVKGQVQRMVYRMISVDFGRMETPKTRKISLREMPKKSSVLEKIALFEEKVTSTTPTKPRQTGITIAKNLPQIPNPNITMTEEMYQRKIEELSAVKLRYNKTDMLYLNLGNGDAMPAIAVGTALLDKRLAPYVVSAAIDLGHRAIDTAFIYGTERQVGEGIKKKIDDGTVTREELFITGKLWSTFHKPELVETACRASLDALGLDYFDLYMIHNPMSLKEGRDAVPLIANVLQFSQYDYLDAWYAMESLVSKGLVKAIGVSNFNSQQIQKILDKGHVKPVVNQVECHPYLTQQPLQAFCRERNITLSCFSVLGSKGTPAEHKSGLTPAIDDPLIKVMASGLNVTPAQLLVRYQIQSGRQAVIKASSPGHLYDVLQALTFVLEPHQIDALNALNKNKRNFDLKSFGELHKNYPFNIPF